MESPRTVEILEALRWLTLTREERRTTAPPEITPLSTAEATAIEAAIALTELGLDVAAALELDRAAENLLRSRHDRRAGRPRPIDALPPVLKIVKADLLALHSFRVRSLFLSWLRSCPDSQAKAVFKALKYGPFTRRVLGRLAEAESVFQRVHGFQNS